MLPISKSLEDNNFQLFHIFPALNKLFNYVYSKLGYICYKYMKYETINFYFGKHLLLKNMSFVTDISKSSKYGLHSTYTLCNKI